MAIMIAVRTEMRRLRAIYYIAVAIAGGAVGFLGIEVLDLGFPWLVVLQCGTMAAVTIALNVWITGRPHFFSSPFKR